MSLHDGPSWGWPAGHRIILPEQASTEAAPRRERRLLGLVLPTLLALVAFALSVAPASADPAILSGAAPGERFGAAIDIHLDRIAIGVPGAAPAGAVRVYHWDGAAWTLEGTLVPPDGQPGDGFGESVAVWGDTVAVGLPGRDDQGPDTGAVDLFRWDGSAWSHFRRVECIEAEFGYGPPGFCAYGSGGDRFGETVALWDAWLVAGAPGAMDPVYSRQSGAVAQLRFDRPRYDIEDDALWTWFGGTAGGELGRGLAIDALGMLVGAPSASSPVLLGTRPDDRSIYSQPDPELGSYCGSGQDEGTSVAIWGDVRATGVIQSNGYSSVRVIDPSLPSQNPPLPGGYACIGYPGVLDDWNDFGAMVDLGEDVLLVGVPTPNGTSGSGRPGEAWVFRRGATAWAVDQQLVNPGATIGDAYGASGALWGEAFVVGAALDDTLGTDAGRVFVFGTPTVCGDGVVQPGEFCDNGPEAPGDLCSPFCTVDVICDDGYDNDGDGRSDWDDPGCTYSKFFDITSEKDPSLPCDDGLDNDGDGLVDVNAVDASGDPACRSPGFPTEQTACQNGIDDDGDGLVDFDGAGDPLLADPECAGRPWSQDEGVVKLYEPLDPVNPRLSGNDFGVAAGGSGGHFIVTSPHGRMPAAYRYAGNTLVTETISLPHEYYASHRFKGDVAVDGTRALLALELPSTGVPGTGIPEEVVVAYEHDGSGWVWDQTLPVPSSGGFPDLFGYAIDVDGDVAVVGANQDDQAAGGAGAAYVYRHDGVQWQLEQKLLSQAPSSGAWFGEAVAVSGDWVAIGVPRDDAAGTDAGAAELFWFDGAAWIHAQTITPALAEAGGFAGSLALEPGRLVVGAPGADGTFADEGAVLVFGLVGGTWTPDATLAAAAPAASAALGTHVALSDGRVAVTSMLGAHLFDRPQGSWAEIGLFARDGRAPFEAIAWLDRALVVGSPDDADLGTGAGAAYLYTNVPVVAPAVPALLAPFATGLAALLGGVGYWALRQWSGRDPRQA